MKCLCGFCRSEFQAAPSHVARGAGKFCSRSCAGQARTLAAGLLPQSERKAKRPGAKFDHAKLLLRKKRYRERHLVEEKERNRRYRLANRDYLARQNKEWRLSHSVYGTANTKRWRLEHPEQQQAQLRAQACNRRAREMGAAGHISRTDVAALWERQPACVVCGKGRGVDHIVEFWQGGLNTLDNLQNLCRQCNVEKTARLRFHPDS